MKPRIRKFLAGLLSLGLLLQAASPLSALADSGSGTAPGLTVTVNDKAYTLAVDSNGQVSTPSGWTEAGLPEVSYDAGTYAFTGTLGTTSNNMDITISGTNSPNVVLKNPSGRAVLATKLAVNDVNDFRAESGGDEFTLTCDSTIACTGNVELKSNSTVSYPGYTGNPLTITSAKNVTIEGTGSNATLYTTKITCSGKLTVKNTGTGPAVDSLNTLWVYDAGSVELTSSNADCTAATVHVEKCTGSVSIANTGTGKAVGVLLVGKSNRGFITYAASSVSINGGIDSYAKIYCNGDINITGTIPGNVQTQTTHLMSLNGNVTVTGIDGDTVPQYLINGPLKVKGDHVTLKGRATVAIIKESNSTSTTNGGIVAEANVLEVQNTSPSGQVGFTKVLPVGSMNYTIYLDADHTPQNTIYISELMNNAEITSNYLYVSATPKAADNSELEVTLTQMSGTSETKTISPTTPSITLGGTTINVAYDNSNDTYTLSGDKIGSYSTTSDATDIITISGVNSGKGRANVKLAINIHGNLVVKDIHDLEVTKQVSVQNSVTCTGKVTMTADVLAQSGLVVNAGGDVTLTGTGQGITICGDNTEEWAVQITSGGNVRIENTSGSSYGAPVSGSVLINAAGDATIKGASAYAFFRGTQKANITAETLTIENTYTTVGGPVNFTRRNNGSIDGYVIATGADANNTTAAKLESKAYTVDAKYLHIGPGTVPPVEPEIPADAEMKLTIGDEVHYLTQNTYSLNLPGSNHVSVTSSPNGYVLMGRLASSGGTGSTPKVTIEGVNGKKLNLELHTQNSPSYLTMGDLEIKNIGNVYVYDWVGGDLTITDVGGVETHPVHGNLTVTNASDVSTGAVYGNMTLTNVSKVTRSYFSNSNGTISIDAAGEVNIYGISSTGSRISAGAAITAQKLVMQFSGLNGSTGTVGPVKFTRKDTTGAYRILTGDSSDAITSQASMSGSTLNKTVGAVYLCIEPGEPEDTSELAITLNGVTAKFGQNAKQAAIGNALITYSATDKAYSISGALTGNVEITGVNGKKPNIKMDNSNGSIVSGNLTVTNVTNFTAESSVGSISTGILRVTAAGAVSLTGEFENTIVSAKSLTMRNDHTDPTLGNVIFTAPDGKTYVATTSESDPTQTIEIPTGGPVSGGYLHIAPAGTTDTPSDDTPDTSAAISGSDSGAGGAVAAVMVGGAAVWGGYQVATRIILHKLLPEGAAIPANRGQLALLVWNAAGRPEPANAPAFTDVADADTAKAAQWCAEQGYLDAKTESTFKPDGLVTKVKVIKVWSKAFPTK